jgi:hypothetical protein
MSVFLDKIIKLYGISDIEAFREIGVYFAK